MKAFEREFIKLGAIALACHLAAMGGKVVPGKPHQGGLAWHCLGIADYCAEMRLLCRETLGRAA
jgi:hypothetical protein